MTKEEILNELNSFLKENTNPYLSSYKPDYSTDLSSSDFKGFCSEAWVIGGMGGGNCWGDGADRPITAEDPAEITLLDKFLEEKTPNITFLQYKKLIKLIKYQEWSDYEYYGNYTEYKCAFITFNDLVECLSNIQDA